MPNLFAMPKSLTINTPLPLLSYKKSTDLHDSDRPHFRAKGGSGPLDPPGQVRAWNYLHYNVDYSKQFERKYIIEFKGIC